MTDQMNTPPKDGDRDEPRVADEFEITMEGEAKVEGMIPPPTGTVTPIRDVPDLFVFRFELGPAILAQLLEKLRQIPLVPIRRALDAKYPGFYHIYYKGEPKYIGRSTRPIRARLREHVNKLSGRKGLSLDDVAVKYAFVEDPSLVDVSEHALIEYFSEHGLADWNKSGYGGKATGYGRGRQKRSKWAEEFPPDLALPITAGSDEAVSLFGLVYQVASSAPVTFSIPNEFRAAFSTDHPEPVEVPEQTLPFEEWVDLISGMLKPGWRVEKEQQAWYITKPRE